MQGLSYTQTLGGVLEVARKAVRRWSGPSACSEGNGNSPGRRRLHRDISCDLWLIGTWSGRKAEDMVTSPAAISFLSQGAMIIRAL